jgi:predicted Ser/Thr protein kinase
MSESLPYIGNRYRLIEPLGTGAMGTVFRAYDRLNGMVVALKQVHVPNSPNQPNALTSFSMMQTMDDPRLGLANEFKVLAALRHPNIISVLDYGFDVQQRPYFTMELIENAREILEVAYESHFNRKIELLIEVLQGLMYLHRHKIVHSDLKPSNILIDRYGRAKILDFGLAMERNITNNMRGTLAYMAPEVMRGDSVTEATDLYAIGVIAYEFFANKRPFRSNDFAKFIIETVQQEVDFSPLKRNGVPDAVIAIIQRLLQKYPEDRYADAISVANALCEATDFPLPRESTMMRDSFLRSAPFVGRRNELLKLEDALNLAVGAQGSAWLVSGEVGIGKSRLIEEFRTFSQVSGALVLKGRFVENRHPDEMWAEILRILVLSVEITDAEANAIRPYVTDIEHLLERHIPHIELERPLYSLLWHVTRIFRREKRPTVLVLEDLHWGNHSRRFVNALCRMVRGLPVMIVGSYRSEEDPYFYGKLPYMNRMALKRLSDIEVFELSAAMLGQSGREPRFLDMLKRETEGNLFFIIEVIRTLATKLERLGNITNVTLPEHIIAEGMVEVARRRLRKVPSHFQPILRLAAVIGRTIDFNIIHKIDDEMDDLEWLQACVNASIFELYEGQWRFTHDRLREAILSNLPLKQREKLHRLVAVAIEELYPNDPGYYAVLLDHWRLANNREKQIEYLQRMGKYKPELTNDED